MTSFSNWLSEILGEAFQKHDMPHDLGRVRSSDRPDLAQFQCNGAMAAAKLAKKNPREIAQNIVEDIKGNPAFEKIEIAGPGFININLTKQALSDALEDVYKDARYGVPLYSQGQSVILDYGGPNIAKPMHVGHLRASVIGDSLRRINDFAGFNALGDVHMGDWGTHMGMIISEYIKTGRQDSVMKVDLASDDEVRQLMEDLNALYPAVSKACKEDENRLALALETTLKIQQKDPEYYTLWEKIREASIIGMRNNFASLNVHFDLWKGEADVHDYIEPMVRRLQEKGIACESEGAIVVHVAQEDDKKEMPPLILIKRDGAVMYGTTDLATLVERMELFEPVACIYVVDQRQHLHFEQVFRAARKGGLVPQDVNLVHAGFGTMNGPDGKPFKTRAGGVMRLDDLINSARDKAFGRMEEADMAKDISKEEKDDIAHKVAIAALKFADLQNQRHSDYIFDLERFSSFEGRTGPYMLYQTVRIRSLLNKASRQGDEPGDSFDLEDEDTDLALTLGEYADFFNAALEHNAPHHLCEFAYKLASAYSSFYGKCHILSEENTDLKKSRLALSKLTADMLEHVLGLLGIDVPQRM